MDSKSQTYITRGKLNPVKVDNEKRRRKDSVRKVAEILRKTEALRTQEDLTYLDKNSDVAKQISKRKERLIEYKNRIVEKEDSVAEIERKTEKLAEIISRARHVICYTGAGISTSARIPDYRGSNGIWTLLQQGKSIEQHDLSLADPTYTHMALFQLYQRKMLRYIVSQNCDGLHLRSGMPKSSLSEIHGNMYIEVCKNCKPNSEYWRLFDTTETTARYNHKTNRRCHICGKSLSDTIVHFGERGNLKWPLNWAGACHHAEQADVILCLGSSLKVMKKYHWLWHTDRPLKKRPKICIVNLQWTPKDKLSTIKINGKCDEIMRLVMKHLDINVHKYSKICDPIFAHASLLSAEELHTVSQPMLKTHLENDDDEEEKPTIIVGKGPLIRTPTKSRNCLKTNLEFKLSLESLTEDDTSHNLKLKEEDIEKLPMLDSLNGLDNTNNETIVKLEDPNCNSTLKEDIKFENSSINLSDISNSKVETLADSIIKQPILSTPSISSIDDDEDDDETSASTNCDSYSDSLRPVSPPRKAKILLPCRESNLITSSINCLTDRLPNWYDVRYVYSGLHSIVLPPPPEINFWSSQIVPVFKMNRKAAECDFCFDTYAEMNCQFYHKWTIEFAHKKIRNGNVIVCECCDFTDDEATEQNTASDLEGVTKKFKYDYANGKKPVTVQAGWYGKGYKKGHYKKKGRRKD